MAIAELKPLLRSRGEAEEERCHSGPPEFSGRNDVCKHYEEAA